MIDISTKKPLHVSTAGDAGSYIMLPVEQLERVRNLLESDNIPFWVDTNAISINGEPAVTVVNLGQKADAKTVQRLLDNAS